MNKAKWNSLSDKGKKAIDAVANKQFGMMAARAFDEEDEENKAMAAAKGMKSYQLSDADKKAIKGKFSVFYTDWVKKNSSKFDAQKLLDAVFESAAK